MAGSFRYCSLSSILMIVNSVEELAVPAEALAKAGVPKGIRTPVFAVKGRRPGPG
jgi:hypothetical protein